MHRSGTSAVARAVAHLGVSTGDGALLQPLPDNPLGYYERADVVRLNDQWLERAGGSWWAPAIVAPEYWATVPEEELAPQRLGIDVLSGLGPDWFVKDPRLALLLPLWDRLALRVMPTVLVVRDPREVVESLRLRSGFGNRRGLALWLAYVQTACAACGTRPTLVVEHGAMLADPTATAERLAEFVVAHGAPGAPDVELAAKAIDPGLHRASRTSVGAADRRALDDCLDLFGVLARRHGRTVGQKARAAVLPDWAVDTLADLTELHLARLGLAAERGARERAEGRLRAQDDSLGAAQSLALDRLERAREADRLAERLSAAETDLVRQVEEARQLRAVIADRDAVLQDFAAARAQLDADVVQLTDEVVRLTAELASASAGVAREQETAVRAAAAAASLRTAQELLAVSRFERDNLAAALDDLVATRAQLDDTLERLLASRSWKVGRALGAPVRLLGGTRERG
jgi:hypothetical protein